MSHLPFRGLLCCPYHLRPPLLQVVQETGPQAEREEEVVCVCVCADVHVRRCGWGGSGSGRWKGYSPVSCSGEALFGDGNVLCSICHSCPLTLCMQGTSLCLQYTVMKLTYNHLPAPQYMCTILVLHPVQLAVTHNYHCQIIIQ